MSNALPARNLNIGNICQSHDVISRAATVLCAAPSKQNKVAAKRMASQQLYVVLNGVKDPNGRSSCGMSRWQQDAMFLFSASGAWCAAVSPGNDICVFPLITHQNADFRHYNPDPPPLDTGSRLRNYSLLLSRGHSFMNNPPTFQ